MPKNSPLAGTKVHACLLQAHVFHTSQYDPIRRQFPAFSAARYEQ
jgi:hypothetical protein